MNEPVWKELDLIQHRNLLEEFIRSNFYGGYALKNSTDRKLWDLKISRDVSEFISRGGKMRVFTIEKKLFEQPNNDSILSNSDKLTILQALPAPVYTEKCTGLPHISDESGIVLVKSDLSSLDLVTKINPNLNRILTSFGFFMYRNRPVFVDDAGIHEYSENKINNVCSLIKENHGN